MTDAITVGGAARGLTGSQLAALADDLAGALDVEAGPAATAGPSAEPAPPAVPAYGTLYRRDPDDGRRFKYLPGCLHDPHVWHWHNAPEGTPDDRRWLDDEEAGRLVPAGGEGGGE